MSWSRGSAKYLVLFDKIFIQCDNRYDIPLSLLAARLSKLSGVSVVFLRSALLNFLNVIELFLGEYDNQYLK